MTEHLPDVDQLPSKERIGFLVDYWAAKLGSHRRWPEGQGLQAELMGLIYVHTIAALKQLAKPAHEREPPHCSTCGCGLTPEPGLTLALLRQLAEKYVGTLDRYPIENYATPQEYAGSELSRFFAWLEMSSGFAVRASQPPDEALEVLRAIDRHLNFSEDTKIHSGSAFHQQVKRALRRALTTEAPHG